MITIYSPSVFLPLRLYRALLSLNVRSSPLLPSYPIIAIVFHVYPPSAITLIRALRSSSRDLPRRIVNLCAPAICEEQLNGKNKSRAYEFTRCVVRSFENEAIPAVKVVSTRKKRLRSPRHTILRFSCWLRLVFALFSKLFVFRSGCTRGPLNNVG